MFLSESFTGVHSESLRDVSFSEGCLPSERRFPFSVSFQSGVERCVSFLMFSMVVLMGCNSL